MHYKLIRLTGYTPENLENLEYHFCLKMLMASAIENGAKCWLVHKDVSNLLDELAKIEYKDLELNNEF